MINSIRALNDVRFTMDTQKVPSVGSVFSKVLEDSINKIDSYQKTADDKIISFIKGNESEVHNVMIAMEEAKLTMQTAIEIRNKVIEAYKEISNIQI